MLALLTYLLGFYACFALLTYLLEPHALLYYVYLLRSHAAHLVLLARPVAALSRWNPVRGRACGVAHLSAKSRWIET